MDKPLKYFLIVTAVFAFFIGVFVVGTIMDKPPASNEFMVIDEDETRMVQAKKQAAATIDTFFSLYPQHRDSAFIRFVFEPTKGHFEHLWGKVLSLDTVHVTVRLTRKEGPESIYYPDKLDLRLDRIEDWMIYLESGTIRGGYTVQAILMIEEERPAANVDSLKAGLMKFRDKLK